MNTVCGNLMTPLLNFRGVKNPGEFYDSPGQLQMLLIRLRRRTNLLTQIYRALPAAAIARPRPTPRKCHSALAHSPDSNGNHLDATLSLVKDR